MPNADSSPNLDMPFILPSQAQKHVTHNEALRVLDAVVQLTVQAFGATAPPPSPSEGAIWALGSAATDAWAGHDGALALWFQGYWEYFSPRAGWRAYGMEDRSLRVWSGTAWDLPALDNLDGLGIGTTYDASNRLAVSAAATLLSHAGSDHRLTLNKAAPIDTATLVYQSGWSGRAEMGLAGNNDFSVKVSPNGSTWTEAMRVNATTGATAALSGFQIDGRMAFHRGNVVASVGQSAGVPTGGLIESGANANGRYVRYADGTQMCWKDTALSQPVPANSYVETNWIYPASFAGSFTHPVATTRSFNDPAGRQNAARYLRGTGGGSGVSSGFIGAFNTHTSAIETRIDAFIIGRWF